MDSFEINTDDFDPSRLREPQPRRKESGNHIPLTDIEQAALNAETGPRLRPDIEEPAQPQPAQQQQQTPPAQPQPQTQPQPQPQAQRQPRQSAASTSGPAPQPQNAKADKDHVAVNLSDHQTIVELTRFFADGRLRIFFGVLLILFAGYLLIASISYISTASADQSIVINSSGAQISANHDGVANSAGWFGAMLSHLLLYRWLGLGAFIVIFYVGALGISMVKLHKFHFWQLTLKSLVASIAISIIMGFLTYGFATDTLWGGEHGFWINNIIVGASSYWGGAALSILMATALVLIFLGPITAFVKSLKAMISRRKQQLSNRYHTSMAAAKEAIRQEKENREKTATKQPEPSIDNQVLTPDPVEPAEPSPAPQPAPATPQPARQPEPEAGNNFDPFAATEIEPSEPAQPTEHAAPKPRYVSIPVDQEPSSEQPEVEYTAPPTYYDTPQPAIEMPPAQDDEPMAEIPTVVDEPEPVDTPAAELMPDPELTELPTVADDELPDSEPTEDNPAETSAEDSTETPAEEIEVEMTGGTIGQQPAPTETYETEEAYDEEMPDDDDPSLYDPTAELGHYQFPGIELLHHRDSNYVLTEEEQRENNQTIISTLDAYGIKIESIKATVGPTITLYEIVPKRGTRISSITRLGADMALSLSAIGIRIIAPIPGKGTIGMEVPNKNPQTVGIRSILSAAAYHESSAQLPIAMGTTIDNQVYVADLAKMPHLLVAGATGMGKSVGLNTIIASLLYKKHPAELKFVLVDPKMVEFSLYRTLEKHFLAKLPDEESAVITDPLKVIATLNSLCIEMDNRYDLLAKANVREIKAYNQKFISRQLNPHKGHRYMPYIVVIIDEFADLIMTAGKEVEQPVARIAQKARAVGIHMILATQRPSVNVITGMIKANFPARIAFRVTQMNDSRTILDRPGAEQLIGRGDMLISRDGIIDRVQCAFIDTDEVEDVCNHISAQIGYSTAYELPEDRPASGEGGGGKGAIADRDPLFPDAGREVITANMGSASLLQRKFNIGYPRAGKLIDQLEQAGVLGPQLGSGKPRAVLMDLYAFENYLDNN